MKAFVTPCSYKPKVAPVYLGKGKLRVFSGMIEIARYVAYLAGEDADKVAAKLNLPPGRRTQQGIWILSKNKQKECRRMGIEVLPMPEPEEKLDIAEEVLNEKD